MNFNEEKYRDLRELIEKAFDGSISPEELQKLDDSLVHNPEHRRYYCEYLYMTIGLMRSCDYTSLTGMQDYDKCYLESLWDALILEEKAAPAVITKEHINITKTNPPHKKEQTANPRKENKILLAVAGVCLSVLILFVAFAYIYQILIPREISTISTSFEASFADSQAAEPGSRLKNRREPFLLQNGLIEITFDGGAKVLLEAPATFGLKSPDRMVLYNGQLYTFVPKYAAGFTVETPNSCLVDMGTEFGIRVEQDGTSDLYLFKGKAALTSDPGSEIERSLTLTPGQAKRVGAGGKVKDIPIQEQVFVRHFHSETGFVWRGQRLCLADIAGNGNGLKTGQINTYIDPVHGYTESLYATEQDNKFHPLPSNTLVDGLFIPDGGQQQIISSGGHLFANCPDTNGECYANLGANPNQSVWRTDLRNGIVQFGGQYYGDQNHPCLVMHANLGITFDLNAIRTMCPELKITRFISKIGIADFEENAGCNADFWALVDGKVRQSLNKVRQKNVLSDFSVELYPSDHFLTLMTTDGGDIDNHGAYQRSYTCDWCVFVEPSLIMEASEEPVNISIK